MTREQEIEDAIYDDFLMSDKISVNKRQSWFSSNKGSYPPSEWIPCMLSLYKKRLIAPTAKLDSYTLVFRATTPIEIVESKLKYKNADIVNSPDYRDLLEGIL